MTIELLDNETEDTTPNAVTNAQEWGNYVERFANPSQSSAMTTVSNLRTNNKNLVTKRRTSYNGNNLNVTSDTKLEVKTEKSDIESVSPI